MRTSKRLLPVLALLLLCASPAASRPSATLSVVPTNITVAGDDATLVTSQTVQVRNVGKGSLKWTVTPPAESWLSVSPTSGTNTGTITISFPSLFVAGTYTSSFTVNYSRQSITVHVTVTVTGAATPPPSGYGPTADITCPGGAVTVLTTDDLQTAVTANAAGTTFCLEAGTHSVTSAVTPKTGDVFIGEYGAILDGSSWTSTDYTQGAFRAHNQDIDDVTIRNLVIRNMPQKGIHAFKDYSDRWTIDYNEISGNITGLMAPSNSTISHNYIHDNIGNPASSDYNAHGGGYGCFRCTNTRFEANEFARNGPEQKIVQATNVTFRNNYVHDDYRDGIWYDTDNTGSVIEDNLVEDEPGQGIFYEISGTGLIQNNTVRRSGSSGIFISTSKQVTITGNTLENNYRGIQYFLTCSIVGGGITGWDLANDTATSNAVTVGASSGALANVLSWVSTCTTAQTDAYRNGAKALTFDSTTYTVPTLTGRYWVWGFNGLKLWTEWLAIPQDTTGTVTTP